MLSFNSTGRGMQMRHELSVNTRLAHLDGIRVGLIILVIAHHAGQAYGPTGGWWAYQETERAGWLGPFFTVNRSFFMSLFFFIAGFLMPQSLDRKGPGAFFRDRLVRLGIPLLIFVSLIIPLMHYAHFLHFRNYGALPFSDYYLNYWLGMGARPADWTGPAWPEINMGHLWFIEHLLIYSGIYSLWRRLRGPLVKREENAGNLGTSSVIIFTVAIGLVTLIVRIWYPIDRWIGFLGFIQVAFADVPRDLGWFIAGVIAYRKNWLLRYPAASGYRWLIAGLGLAGLYYGLAALRAFPSALYIPWEMFLCTGLTIGIIVLCREHCSSVSSLVRELADGSYGAYLVHVPVLVVAQFGLAGYMMSPSIKWFAATVTGILVSFTLASLLKRVPGARSVL